MSVVVRPSLINDAQLAMGFIGEVFSFNSQQLVVVVELHGSRSGEE